MSINVAPAGEKAGEGAGERACMPVPHRASRVDLVERLWQAAEAQVSAHEARLKALPPEDLASEAHAKSLATLARTIKDLIELHAAALEAERASDESADDGTRPDAAMENLETLRAELARRLGLGEPQ